MRKSMVEPDRTQIKI